MATERLSMRQIRVAEGLRVGLGTVSTVERRARAAGLDWAQVDTLTDEGLEARAIKSSDTGTRSLVGLRPACPVACG